VWGGHVKKSWVAIIGLNGNGEQKKTKTRREAQAA